MFEGLQSLSDEVSEQTHSHLLKLEKENQSLLRTIQELRYASNSIKSGHEKCVHECHGYSCSSTQKPKGSQTQNLHKENYMDSAATEQMWNGDENCPHQPHTVKLEGVQTATLFTESPVEHIQEERLLEDRDGSEHFRELMSDLEVLENCHNRLHCIVEHECDHSSGSKSSSPSHISIFTGLPTHSSYASKQTQRLEAKCKALDTVNQHLQAALDSAGRFCVLYEA